MHAQSVPWIGQRIRQLRKEKGLSQRDIERATSMKSAYTSRVETGRTVPSVASLERFASALSVPLYQLFLDPSGQSAERRPVMQNGDNRTEGFLQLLQRYVHGMGPSHRALVLGLAKLLALNNSNEPLPQAPPLEIHAKRRGRPRITDGAANQRPRAQQDLS